MNRSLKFKAFAWVFVTLSAVVFSCSLAFGQAETGALNGTVRDSSGAVVAGAEVNIVSQRTAAVRTAKTDNAGLYTVTNLEPGPYQVKVSAQGFGQFSRDFSISPG